LIDSTKRSAYALRFGLRAGEIYPNPVDLTA